MVEAAVILAGGRGIKAYPYGLTQPKACFPVGGRPVIRHHLAFLASRMEEVAVVVGHRGAQVARAVGLVPRVRIVRDDTLAGTAPATQAGWLALPRPDAHVLVLYGDCLVHPEDLEALLLHARDGEAAALVAPLGPEDPRDWIVARVRAEAVEEFLGHPREGTHRVAGAFVLPPRVRPYLSLTGGEGVRVPVGGMPPPEEDLCEALNAYREDGHPVRAVVARHQVVDMDRPWHILQAHAVYASWYFREHPGVRVAEGAHLSERAHIEGSVTVLPGGRLGDGARVRGNVLVGEGAAVENRAILEGDVILAPRARLEDYCKVENATVGADCRVSHAAEVLGGVLMDGAYLMHHCEVYGVLGRKVDIGAGTVCGTLRFDDGDTAHRVAGGRRVPRVGANAVYLGDYVRTGVHATFLPGRTVGPYSCIGPGVLVDEDIPPRTLVTLKQELVRRPWGSDRYGW